LSNNLFTHNFIRIIFTIQGYSMTTTTNPPINEENLSNLWERYYQILVVRQVQF